MTLNTPPVMPGLPLVGNALEFSRDPIGLLKRGYETLGPIFSFRLANKPAVALIGPDNSRFFFEQTDKLLSMKEVYRFLIPMFGEKIFFAADYEEYKEQRAIMLPAFSGRKMPSYVQVMAEEVRKWLDSLGEQGEFELVSTFERLTMYVAAAAFLGADFRRRLGEEFRLLYRDLAAGIEFLIPPNWPLPKFRRRDRARARLRALIQPVIAERRANPEAYDDFLQVFVNAHYSDNRPLPDEIIESFILGMVFAGHETTAGHASWGLVQLLQDRGYMEKVKVEVDEILMPGSNQELSLEQIRSMDHLDWALKETERTKPVASMLMRYVRQPFEICGYHIPADWLALVSPAISHRLPELFAEPDRYDPERFSPGREEDRKHTFSLIGFGGGLHKCLGMNFAYNEMKVIFSLLLHQYELELLSPDPKTDRSTTTSRPQRPCIVRYKRRG